MAWPEDNEPRRPRPAIEPMEPEGSPLKGCLIALGTTAAIAIVAFTVAWLWP